MLSYMLIGIIIYLHWYSCIFWVLVRNDANWVPYYLQGNHASALRFLYQDQRVSPFSKYLCVLYQGVQCMCGSDIGPLNSLSIFYAGIGVFMASVINANIFGQLQLILEYLLKEDKIFQKKMAKFDESMAFIYLPISIQIKIRSDLTRFQPLEVCQN